MTRDRELPAMPAHPEDGRNRWLRLLDFRRDMFAALPRRLYRGWMPTVRTPFYNSFMLNDPKLAQHVLRADAESFPKSDTAYEGIKSLLGRHSVFVTNGAEWRRQRRIINPAFEGGRVKQAFPAMQAAADEMVLRFRTLDDGQAHDIEFECSHFAADVIFRTLFSIPIDHHLARAVFENFQNYQREQPVWNITNLIRAPKWIPRRQSHAAKRAAGLIRGAIGELVRARLDAIKAGVAPDDLATKIMTTADPMSGERFDFEEMVDQVAIFFLAGHETSASALAWGLYLLAFDPKVQSELHHENKDDFDFASLMQRIKTRNVFHETLRLYAPVPMMVREATSPQIFRDRAVKPGDLCMLSAWHSGRHERIWVEPHAFIPDRWNDLPDHCRAAYYPFSGGDRICVGAGFATVEGVLALAVLTRNFEFSLGTHHPTPVAHLTTRSKDGIHLVVRKR